MSKKSIIFRNIKIKRKIVNSKKSNIFINWRSKKYSLIRYRNRCFITGRPRGNFRQFGICRNFIRKLFLNGDMPYLKKSSW
ncbi:30S ribosomal protein S14 [Candidatus Vidania fulgoroideorum]